MSAREQGETLGSRTSGPREAPYAWVGGRLATGLCEVTDDPAVLDGSGWWAVVVTYEGKVTCARFAEVRTAPLRCTTPWVGPDPGSWQTSLSHGAYLKAVDTVRAAIAAGTVYQANVCRVLSAPMPQALSLGSLAVRLSTGNPAPYAGVIDLGAHGPRVVTASPELFLSRQGDVVESRPIKGTAASPESMLPKDSAENVMIVDLVRNDLGRVCRTGSVGVPSMLAMEPHPGLVHLVSTVRGTLRGDVGWADLLAATFPPGSVTGAPKSSAMTLIDELEPVPRGPYCGAVGWVDAGTRTAVLAVGIRTFWLEAGMLMFGTGAGITWSSDPEVEWQETELKAARLVGLASSGYQEGG